MKLLRWLFLSLLTVSCGDTLLQGKSLPKFSGTNQYYLFYKPDSMVEDLFKRANMVGITVVRTWAACEGALHDGYCFQPSAYAYHEPTFAHFDRVIALAKRHNIQLILPLVNNWHEFGGVSQYLKWFNLSNHDDFFRDQRVKDAYKAYVKYFLNRVNTVTGVAYKDDPTILAFELGNELRCSDLSALYAWTDEMAKYVKLMAPNHLLTTGSEGAISSDVYQTHRSPYIDFVSFHLYPESWGFDQQKSNQYIRDHISVARLLKKPIFLGEFGLRDKGKRRDAYRQWYQILKQENVEGVAFWLLSGRQEDGSLYPDYDGFTVYVPESTDVIDIIKEYSDYANTSSVKKSWNNLQGD